jgi:hypothetical protein
MRNTTMRKLSLNRRTLLKGVGAGLALSPLAALLEGKRAQSAPGRVKRVLLFCTMGTQQELWTPTAVSGDNITTFNAGTQPLSAIREHIVMIEGLASGTPGEGHGSPQSLTGRGYGNEHEATSVDQFIAEQLRTNMGIMTPVPLLLLGDGTNNSATPGKVQFYKKGTQQFPLASPATAFNTVFKDFLPGVPVDARKNRRIRTYERVQAELAELQGRVGPAERSRLEAHRLSIAQIQASLTQTPTTPVGSCMAPGMPSAATNPLTNNRTHLDLIVSAFACDITRVAGIHYGNDQGLKVDLPSVGLSGDQHNDFIHSGQGENFARLAKFDAWLAGEFAYVVGELKKRNEADGSGTLLDNTLVVWCRDLGEAQEHNQHSMRFVLAGGANKYLKTSAMGRYIKGASKRGAPSSAPADRHERVLWNVCEAMGITVRTGFGDPMLAAAYKKPLEGVST